MFLGAAALERGFEPRQLAEERRKEETNAHFREKEQPLAAVLSRKGSRLLSPYLAETRRVLPG